MRQAVQIEAALHVLQFTLQGTNGLSFWVILGSDRQGLGGLCPGRGQRRLFGVLPIPHEYICCQRFRPHAEMQSLFRGKHANRAPPFEKSVERQFRGQNSCQSHQNERNDERDASLACHALRAPSNVGAATPSANLNKNHPATSMSRRMRPQSLNSMMSSTATGRVQRLSGCTILGGGHWVCQVWLTSR